MAEDCAPLRARIEEAVGAPLRDPAFLEEALAHRSYVNEASREDMRDNERFEFLGDAVLQLAISDHLMKRLPDQSEGALSKCRSGLVNEKSLAHAARSLDLGRFVRLGRGEDLTRGREKDSILANTFEAVVAAVYLSEGLDGASRFVVKSLSELLDRLEGPDGRLDHKTTLQELTQRLLRQTPVYRVVLEEGPDHEKIFETEVLIDDKVYGRGKARSKKDSEQMSAQEALKALKEELGPDPAGSE
jgi:ribonuclease III